MIVVKLMGGLGNQMFQYAAGRGLSDRLGTDLYLDTTGFDDMHPDDTPRHYELDCFLVRAKLADGKLLARVRPPEYRAGLLERATRQLSKNGPIFTYGESATKNHAVFQKLKNNTRLVGWWQDEKYFAAIREKLIKDFSPKKTGAKYKMYKKKIAAAGEPVALHVRRGDYLTNKHANKHHGLAPVKYYNEATKLIGKKVKSPTFFVFSDDIAWCKSNIKAGKAVYVEGTAGHEDVVLMSQCQHNIIANSSFSWWGAWLNQNPDKIVIAPKVWFQNKLSDSNSTIVPEGWIRL